MTDLETTNPTAAQLNRIEQQLIDNNALIQQIPTMMQQPLLRMTSNIVEGLNEILFNRLTELLEKESPVSDIGELLKGLTDAIVQNTEASIQTQRQVDELATLIKTSKTSQPSSNGTKLSKP